jgi:hypothetical protein
MGGAKGNQLKQNNTHYPTPHRTLSMSIEPVGVLNIGGLRFLPSSSTKAQNETESHFVL